MEGGCAVIFPGGGGRDEHAWYPGIGQVALDVLTRGKTLNVFLLPIHEEAESEAHVYTALRRRGAERSRAMRIPVRIRYAEPRPLSDVIQRPASREEVTERLQRDYEATFPPAARDEGAVSGRGLKEEA
jgi:hypothetical protein